LFSILIKEKYLFANVPQKSPMFSIRTSTPNARVRKTETVAGAMDLFAIDVFCACVRKKPLIQTGHERKATHN
jgi:hypothetical protein